MKTKLPLPPACPHRSWWDRRTDSPGGTSGQTAGRAAHVNDGGCGSLLAADSTQTNNLIGEEHEASRRLM